MAEAAASDVHFIVEVCHRSLQCQDPATSYWHCHVSQPSGHRLHALLLLLLKVLITCLLLMTLTAARAEDILQFPAGKHWFTQLPFSLCCCGNSSNMATARLKASPCAQCGFLWGRWWDEGGCQPSTLLLGRDSGAKRGWELWQGCPAAVVSQGKQLGCVTDRGTRKSVL